MRTSLVLAPLVALGCAGPPPAAPGPGSASAEVAAAPPPAPEPIATPLVDLGSPNQATVDGQAVAFDGVAEGLFWPSLSKAYHAKAKPGERVAIAAPRNARVVDVLRAAWTLHDVDVEVQTIGPGNAMRALVLEKRPPPRTGAPAPRTDGATAAPTCHAAVFVSPEGKLRVALPGGSIAVRDTDELLASIAHGARSCTIRWLAFGGETNDMAWGWVFDVAVQTSHAAPAARVVLGEPIK